ncbi:hypothetical protein RCL1_002549 [Eukaryota sp. TZLM3-RCL]
MVPFSHSRTCASCNLVVTLIRESSGNIIVQDLPPTRNISNLKAVISDSSVLIRHSTNQYGTSYTLTTSVSNHAVVQSRLSESQLFSETWEHTFVNPSGRHKKQVKSACIYKAFPPDKPQYAVFFREPDQCIGTFERLKAEGEDVSFSFSRKLNFDVYSMSSLSSALSGFVDVTVKKAKNSASVIFSAKSARSYFRAAAKFLSLTEPLKLTFTDPLQICMVEEMKRRKLLSEWEHDCNVSAFVGKNEKFGSIQLTVHGEGFNRGKFMSLFNNYSSEFSQRFSITSVSPQQLMYFVGKRKGDKSLFDKYVESTNKDLGSCIAFKFHKKHLQHYISHEKSCQYSLQHSLDFVARFLASQTVSKQLSHEFCVFCHRESRSGLSFTHCGHSHCLSCFKAAVLRQFTCNQLESEVIACPSCNLSVAFMDVRRVFNHGAEFNDLLKKITSSIVISFPHLYPNFTTCKNFTCRSIMTRVKSYSYCKDCGQGQCHSCGALNDSTHFGKTCDQYSELKVSAAAHLETLFVKAEQFADEYWNISPSLIQKIRNPNLLEGCPAIQRFSKVVVKHGIACLEQVKFAWHGTQHQSISSISYDGFDPSCRRGQAHGPGEYFGLSDKPDVAVGYCGGRYMFVAAILPLDGLFKEIPGFCYVVNNPQDFSVSYCLPLLVLELNRPEFPSQQIEFKHVDIPTPIHFEYLSVVDVDPTSTLSCVARWQWCDDSGFKPYTEDISRLIESRWALFNTGDAVESFVAGRIVRLVDDVPQDYLINFQTMKQTNIKTGYTRAIKRELVSITISKNYTWQYFDQGVWTKYDSFIQNTIEDRYRNYVSTKVSAIVKLFFPGRSEQYMLDFASATQKNLNTKSIRKIRRLDSQLESPLSDMIMTFHLIVKVVPNIGVVQKVQLSLLKMINITTSSLLNNCFDFSFDNTQYCFVLRLQHELLSISSILAAIVCRTLNQNNVDVLLPKEEESEYSANLQPRLTKLLSGITPLLETLSRETLYEYISHVLVFECNCTIHGAFVRDYLIRNVTVSGIDVCCPTDSVDESINLLVSILNSSQLNFVIEEPISITNTLQQVIVSCGTYNFQLDFTMPESSRMIEGAVPPFVEADVSNLQVSKASYLSFREPEASKNTDLATVVAHCMNQEFVFYYDLNHQSDFKESLKRYLDKGWVCLSHIPEEHQEVFIGRQHLYRPVV